jgi:Domain of unknown function (DUF4260)
MTNTSAIRTHDLTKSYGSLTAVRGLNLSVAPKRITAFLGQNGAGKSIGAAHYNFAHTLVTPAILLAIAFFAARPQLFPFVLIWTAHIGIDRLLGFGLKYPTHFRDTQLQHV